MTIYVPEVDPSIVIVEYAAGRTVTVNQGDDLLVALGNSLPFDWPDPTHALGLDGVGVIVRFKCTQATWIAASVESTLPGYHIEIEATKAETEALTFKRQRFEVEATLANTDVVTQPGGGLVVVKDIPPVAAP